MKPFVVATDLTPAAEAALRKAVEMAKRLGNDVVLVHAWEPVVIAVLDAAVMESAGRMSRHTLEAQTGLNQLIERYRPEHGKLTARLLEGKAPVEVARVAREIDAELVFIGSAAHTGLRRLFGGVGEDMIRASPVPVVVVRRDMA